MTLKEQIMKLQTYKMYEGEDTVYVERDDVLKALEQQESEDCISREAVEKITWEEPSYDDALNVLTEVRDKVRALPPVTPRPKGKWIDHKKHCENLGVKPSGLGTYEWCSNCDCGIDVTEFHRNHYNFCPNCGAKMESEDKE